MREARPDVDFDAPADAEDSTSNQLGNGKLVETKIECFDEKGSFIPARMGAALQEENPTRLGHDRRLWRYVNGVYRPDGEDWVCQRVREVVGDKFRKQQMEEVKAYLRAALPSLGHTPIPEFINVSNGLLDWRTGGLQPHSAEVLSTNQLPVRWNPAATASRTKTFFAEVLPEDAIELVEELLGYAIYPGNPLRKAVMFLGPGGNGKSVLLRLIKGLAGADNISSVPLQALGEDRFSAADVFGKLVNICGDLDARAIERTDLFKQLTGGDLIRAQHKFKDAFSFTSYALPIFSANEPPRTADQTNAWFDRWIIIPMVNIFEGTPKMDTNLDAKLAAEIEGVLVLAVTGLRRLMARGGFAFPESVQRARGCYRQQLDTVRAFVSEECRLSPDGWVDRAALYCSYREWCKDQGRFALAATSFNTNLVQAYAPGVGPRKRHGRPGWVGIELGPDSFGGDDGDDGDGVSHRPEAAPGGARGDRGDDGDDLPNLKPYARARGGKVGTASPPSPRSPQNGTAAAGIDPQARVDLLAMAAARGFPEISIRPACQVGGDAARWRLFATKGLPADLALAAQALRRAGGRP